jgi:hypothetical protein
LNTRLPGNLDEIFPLRFRLRDELRFFRAPGAMVVERVARQQRYSLKLWQYEMLARFDGSQTFEQVAKEVYSLQPGAFTAMGLLNFYNWLYDEDLVLCECASIFELVGEQSDSDEHTPKRLSSFARELLSDLRVIRGVKITAAIIFSLSVFRLAYVTAPIFEPPADRLYAETERLLRHREEGISHGELERSAELSPVEKVELAAKIEPAAPVQEIVETAPPAESPEPAPAVIPKIDSIETLRTQLEECRIRRDEFYLQNNEDGYRREVHRMTNLAKEIGDIENGL